MSQIFIASKLPETIYFPSGLIATEFTEYSCSFKVFKHSAVFISQIFMVESPLPETIYFPSGLIVIEYTELECPSKVFKHFPLLFHFQFL